MICEPAKMLKLGYFEQNYTVELFIALEIVYYCCFSLGGNLDFLQKKIFKIDNWSYKQIF